MSALGQKQTPALQKAMSALLPKADVCGANRHVCFGPIADMPPTAQLFACVLPMRVWPKLSQINLRRNQTNSGKIADIFDLSGPERNSDSDYRNRDYRQSR
jgi:hypothetical protein